jgi:hypothetical protein
MTGPAIGATCTVCLSSRVKLIDAELERGVMSRRRIARQFQLDNTSLNRHFHNGHVVQTVQVAQLVGSGDPLDVLGPMPVGGTIEDKLDWLVGKLEEAINKGQVRSDVIRELRMLYKEQREAKGPVAIQATTYKDVEGWQDYEAAVYEALGPFPEARQTLAKVLRARLGHE